MDTHHKVMEKGIGLVVLFDGVCNLCHGTVRWIIQWDRNKVFRFASLQSGFGKQQLERLGKSVQGQQSVVLLDGERAFERSDAVLEIIRHIPSLRFLYFPGKAIPRPIRDWMYNIISRYRYVIFGRKAQCELPRQVPMDRFIQ